MCNNLKEAIEQIAKKIQDESRNEKTISRNDSTKEYGKLNENHWKASAAE